MDPISLSAQGEARLPPGNMKHGCQGKLVMYVHSFSRFSHDACKNIFQILVEIASFDDETSLRSKSSKDNILCNYTIKYYSEHHISP